MNIFCVIQDSIKISSIDLFMSLNDINIYRYLQLGRATTNSPQVSSILWIALIELL